MISRWIVIASMPATIAPVITDSASFASPARRARRNDSRASPSALVSTARVASSGPAATSSLAAAAGPGRASM